MQISKTLLSFFLCFISGVFIIGQTSLQYIEAIGEPNLRVARSNFSDSYCSISGPLVAEHDPATFPSGIYTDIGGGQELAVPFTATRNMTLSQICIIGGYKGNCNISTFPDYILTIYTDNSGTVGNEMASYTVQGNNVETGATPFGPTSKEIGVSLDFPNLTLTSGTTVWFSIVSTNAIPGCSFFWETSPTGNGGASSQNGGISWTPLGVVLLPNTFISFNLAYYLGEAVDPSIPTLTGWSLISLSILLVIIGIVALRERQLAY